MNAQTDRAVGDLLRHVRVHILVSMNPDGYARAAVQKHCYGVAGRYVCIHNYSLVIAH